MSVNRLNVKIREVDKSPCINSIKFFFLFYLHKAKKVTFCLKNFARKYKMSLRHLSSIFKMSPSYLLGWIEKGYVISGLLFRNVRIKIREIIKE